MAKKYELRYIGGGAFLPHLPSRNLTKEEVRRLGKDRLLATGLYEEVISKRKTAEKPMEETWQE